MMLYLITGLPRSGKGAYCHNMCSEKGKRAAHINVDTIRKVLHNKGLYTYPYQHDAEPTVLGLTVAAVAQLCIDNQYLDILVDDYALLYTPRLQEDFMQAVNEAAGMEVQFLVKHIDERPATCIGRLTDKDRYLAPIIAAQAVRDLKDAIGKFNCTPDCIDLFPGVDQFVAGLYATSKNWQGVNRSAMGELDPNA